MSVPIDTIMANDSNQEKIAAEESILTEQGFYWREREGVKVLVSAKLEENGFANGFSTRLGGVSPFPENSLNLAGFDEDNAENIFENRRRFLNVFGDGYRLTSVWQIHSDLVKTVLSDEEIQNTEDRCDALTSDKPGLLIGVKTADCVPVLLGDPVTGAYAAIHAGWRGTVESIVVKTVEAMFERFSVNPKNLVCAIGPAATAANYEIGQDVIDAFGSKFPGSDHLFIPTKAGHAKIDLHQANFEQLESMGISGENISVAPFCTMERTDLFFSYRVEKRTMGKTGRLMSVIGQIQS